MALRTREQHELIDNSTLPTVLIIGATGQSGLELTQCLSQCANVISTQREVKMSNHISLSMRRLIHRLTTRKRRREAPKPLMQKPPPY